MAKDKTPVSRVINMKNRKDRHEKSTKKGMLSKISTKTQLNNKVNQPRKSRTQLKKHMRKPQISQQPIQENNPGLTSLGQIIQIIRMQIVIKTKKTSLKTTATPTRCTA